MNRAFVLPISAAVVGALLAVGVAAAKRNVEYAFEHRGFVTVDVSENVDFAGVEAVLDGLEITVGEVGFVEEVLADVRAELRKALEDAELTARERAALEEALEDLKAPPPSGATESGGN